MVDERRPLGQVTTSELMELVTTLANAVLWQGSAIKYLSTGDQSGALEAVGRAGKEIDLFIRAVEEVVDLKIIDDG